MSKKYYIMLARLIKDNTWSINNNRIYKNTLIQDLCYELKKDNSLFNKQRFIDACE